jgi:hypothetical protein
MNRFICSLAQEARNCDSSVGTVELRLLIRNEVKHHFGYLSVILRKLLLDDLRRILSNSLVDLRCPFLCFRPKHFSTYQVHKSRATS